MCRPLQRVMVGEVKIKARRRRLAPQPRLNPLFALAGVDGLCKHACVCAGFWGGGGVMGEGYLRGADMHR